MIDYSVNVESCKYCVGRCEKREKAFLDTEKFNTLLGIQSTLPKSKSHKSNNRLSRRSIKVFSIFSSFLLHISRNVSKSKLFLQSQQIRLRQS